MTREMDTHLATGNRSSVAGLTPQHFGRWVDLWHATVDAHFSGEVADHAKVQGSSIAWSMSRRLMGESGSEFVTIRRPTLDEVLARTQPIAQESP